MDILKIVLVRVDDAYVVGDRTEKVEYLDRAIQQFDYLKEFLPSGRELIGGDYLLTLELKSPDANGLYKTVETLRMFPFGVEREE